MSNLLARVPPFIDGARVLFAAMRSTQNQPTGWTRHLVSGSIMQPPAALAIVQYEDSSDVYLLYCDSDWNAVTDTVHGSLNAAKAQAALEFEGVLEWEATRW